jgi:HAD superfamily hydrolase (TIGR01509 family)
MVLEIEAQIQAIIFDFDGLILDTEVPAFQSWQELYSANGCTLPFSAWSQLIGTMDSPFDPFDLLEEQMGCTLDRAAVDRQRQSREDALIAMQSPLPGVEDLLASARKRGLKLAVASSSSRDWVSGHLSRLGLLGYFECLRTKDDVAVTKPDPALYLSALDCLGVEPENAMAIEDSPNGVLAAKRAGLFCVAVPNSLTRRMRLDHADLVLESLDSFTLDELLEHISRNGHSTGMIGGKK